MHAAIDDPELSSLVISRDQLIVALSEQHGAATKSAIELKALSQETIFVPKRHASMGFHELVLSACREAGFVPARMQSTRLLQTAVALVAGGMGVALIPASFRDNLQIRGVVYRPLAGKTPVAELIAVWRTGNTSSLLTRFRRELRVVLRRTRS